MNKNNKYGIARYFINFRKEILLGSLALCMTLSGAPPAHAADSASLSATIRRTEFGVPHITASDWRSLGFGLGYANAEDRVCDMAEVYVTARAERSLYWGAAGGNLESDLYRQRLIDSGVPQALLRNPGTALDRDYRALVSGFVAGYNKYLKDTPTSTLPEPCRGKPWVTEISELDYFLNRAAGRRGPLDYVPEIANASPPSTDSAALGLQADTIASFHSDSIDPANLDGSNGWALGTAVTQRSTGMLLSSPHWPWETFNRPGFWAQKVVLAHLTIPGQFNHIGVSRVGSAIQQIGHSDDIARTHTVSAVPRDVVYKLTLDPSNPQRYLYDGKPRPIQAYPVTVRVREADGTIASRTKTIYWSHFGPIIQSKERPWDRAHAYTLRSVMNTLDRLKVDEHKLALDRAKSVNEIRAILSRYQLQDTNTIAVDKYGNTLFADIGNIPHLDDDLLQRCGTVKLLDGSRSECELGTDGDSAREGIFGPKRSAVQMGRSYVANSNNPPRYVNPEFPLNDLDDAFGPQGVPLGLRPRMGLTLISQRLDGTDGLGGKKFTFENIQKMFLGTRVYAAEVVLDDLLKQCAKHPSGTLKNGEVVDLRAACDTLSKWDRTYSTSSRGGHIFREFAREGGIKFSDAFDPTHPATTPNKLELSGNSALNALARAVAKLNQASIPLDAPLGAIQKTNREGEAVSVPGGDSNDGVFNYMSTSALSKEGYKAVGATGFFYFIEFDKKIKSKGMLIYGLSSDRSSVHFSDQMKAYGNGIIVDWKFNESDILADPFLKMKRITN
ncbi:penicillin acylase family protein [Cupriavidus basilensis]|uniref:penicillin acylase family protein n=1 Tax=Cupriavidus basilensis TaxID=68895 RepID=UPI0039F6A09A